MQTNNPAPIRIFARHFCDDCLMVHWMEEVTRTRVVCHGPYFTPKETPTHYTRWNAGTIELCEKANTQQEPALDWLFYEQIADQQEPEHLKNQDW